MRLALALLTLLAGMTCAPARAADGRASLTVLSLNVLHGGPWSGFAGDGQQLERRMDLIAEELAALRPDVVALQEVAVSRRLGNVPERLARRLGLYYVYAPATTRVFGEGIQWDVSELPRCEHVLDPRVLLHARIDTPWGPIDVFSTHISRDECQARRVTALVGQRRSGLPSILMGDFNLGETSPAIRAMTEEAGLVDAYRHVNPGALGATARQPIETPEPMARRRIDYIFLVPGLEVRGRVLRSRVVLDAPHRLADGRTLWPSDHYGVLAELALPPLRTAQ